MKIVKKYLSKLIKSILEDEHFISGDIGYNETEILVVKYSYRLRKFEIISDNRIRKTPLEDIEKQLRRIVREQNKQVNIALDYPTETREYMNYVRGSF